MFRRLTLPEMSAFSLHDSYFDPESGRISAYFSKLFMLIGQESLQYCILDTEKNTFIALADYRLQTSLKTPEVFYSDISQLISQDETLQKKFSSVVIGLDSVIHTLVPDPFFDSDQSRKYLEFNFGFTGNDQVRADRLEEIDAYNVYLIPLGLADLLKVNYKEAAFFHRTSALVRAISHHEKKNRGQAIIFLNVREHYIDLVSFEGGRLVYFNSYLCMGREDVLYYTLYSLEQLKSVTENVRLFVSGMLDSGTDLHYLLEQYIQSVSFSGRLSCFNFSPLLSQLPSQRYQELYALALCGS